jgi:hypothetical protein
MTRHEKNVRAAITAVEAAKDRLLRIVLVEIDLVATSRGLSRILVGDSETTCHRGSRTVACKPVLALVDMYNDVHPAGFIAEWTAEKGWL